MIIPFIQCKTKAPASEISSANKTSHDSVKKENKNYSGLLNYNKQTDKTTLTTDSFGIIIFPGQWIKRTYLPVSRHYLLKRISSDSTILLVAKNKKENHVVWEEGQSDIDFVVAFYQWDNEEMLERGMLHEKIKQDYTDNYIVWRAFKENNFNGMKENSENFLLYGLKNGLLYNFNILSSKLNDEEKIKLLEKLYKDN